MSYKRLKIVDVAKVQAAMRLRTSHLKVEETLVGCQSTRMLTYINSTTCVHCGLVGTYFAVEKHHASDKSWHFNLYGVDASGKEVMITSDHIIPKSKGGSNNLPNRQPMCSPCNTAKGSFDSVEEGITHTKEKEKGVRKELGLKLIKARESVKFCTDRLLCSDTSQPWAEYISKHLAFIERNVLLV